MSEAHIFTAGILLAWLAGIRVYLTVFGVGVGTLLYNEQAAIVRQFYPDAEQATAYYANIDLAVNALTLFVQLLVTRALLSRFGIAPALLILDTHLLTNQLWSQTLFGDYPAWLDDELLARHYDLHLLLSPEDVEWTADGQRCQPELADRRAFFQGSLDWMQQHQQPVVVIRGSWEERRTAAFAAVKRLLNPEQPPVLP